MPSPSKNKGSAYERYVAKYLSEKYKSSFIRSPGSGAYVGGTNQKRTEFLHEGQIRSFKGDIVPGEEFPLLNVECKSYADFTFNLLFSDKCTQLETWIEQLMDVAEENDLNVLFMKITRKAHMVAVQADKTWVSDNFHLYKSKNHGDWVIMDFDHFFANNTELFKEYSSK